MTVGLNSILGAIIIWKLWVAQRAARLLSAGTGAHTQGIQTQYMRTSRFIAESSVLWIIAGALYAGTGMVNVGTMPIFGLLFNATVVGIAWPHYKKEYV
jgi:putative effector of murein hydrolase